MSDPTHMTLEKIDKAKTDILLGVLYNLAQGPREAYAILTICLYRLNFELMDKQVSIDQLCNEVAITLRSIAPKGKSN